MENGTSQSGEPKPDKRTEPGILLCYFIKTPFEPAISDTSSKYNAFHYHFYMLAGAKGYCSGRRLLCDKTEVLWGKRNKRNVLYTSIFNSHKRHIIFPCRQGVQQVFPSLVSGPSPTKSGYLVSDPSSPIRDDPATLTCHSSPWALSHRTETCDSEGH